MAGSDLLVADYQATGDRSSMTTLRTFTATSMARLRALQSVVPAGALDDLLRAAQTLDQVEQVSVHTCSSCEGPLIGAIQKQDYGVSLPGELYNRSCHSQPVFTKHPELIVRQPEETFPETDYVVSNHICLPLYFDLTDDQIEDVVDSLDKAVQSF